MEPKKHVKIIFLNSLDFLKDAKGLNDNAEVLDFLKLNASFKPFFLKVEVGRDKQGEDFGSRLITDYQATNEQQAKEFISLVIGLSQDASSVYGAITAIPFKPDQTPSVSHHTKANAEISAFAMPTGLDQWEVHGIGFHIGLGSKTYKMTHYYQPKGTTSLYAKNKEVHL